MNRLLDLIASRLSTVVPARIDRLRRSHLVVPNDHRVETLPGETYGRTDYDAQDVESFVGLLKGYGVNVVIVGSNAAVGVCEFVGDPRITFVYDWKWGLPHITLGPSIWSTPELLDRLRLWVDYGNMDEVDLLNIRESINAYDLVDSGSRVERYDAHGNLVFSGQKSGVEIKGKLATSYGVQLRLHEDLALEADGEVRITPRPKGDKLDWKVELVNAGARALELRQDLKILLAQHFHNVHVGEVSQVEMTLLDGVTPTTPYDHRAWSPDHAVVYVPE